MSFCKLETLGILLKNNSNTVVIDPKVESELTFDEYRNDTPRNNLILGKMGEGTKIRTFKEKEFIQELAPKHAMIEHTVINGENIVIMKYTV